jgi:hypothetical protein
MTKTARARKKANHRLHHPHPAHVRRPSLDHPEGTPLPVLCPACRPGPKKWDRSQAGKAV